MILRRITAFRLVTARSDELARFYRALGFIIGERQRISSREMEGLGLQGRGERTPLRLGAQCVELDAFEDAGAPYPAEATASDLVFQHFALVTDDAASAWARAQAAGASPISAGGPVKLPRSSGGVTAIKFRDPEGHPLEFLQFPPGADNGWSGRGVLGIDHSAISVSDAAASLAFYADRGLAQGAGTLNEGREQEALDGVTDPRVTVLPMAPVNAPPHLELLAYEAPLGRRGNRHANDIAATRVVWAGDEEVAFSDPDGHLHQVSARLKAKLRPPPKPPKPAACQPWMRG